MIDWLKHQVRDDIGTDTKLVYSLNDIKALNLDVIELADAGILVIQKEDDLHVNFALLQEDCDDGEDRFFSVVFHGRGPSGSLRECRHTYWGEDGNGYIFYPPFDLIIAALNELKKYFDGD